MEQKYTSYIENVYEEYQTLKKVPNTDEDEFMKISLDELIKKGYINFKASKKPLVRLSILIEMFAKKNKTALLATFEDEGKFKYAEDRYLELMRKLPRVWVIGNFKNPFLAQNFPGNAKTISCNSTSLSTVWAVITKGPAGPMGLVAEEQSDETFRGFFSVSPKIVQSSIDLINYILKEDIDINKVEE
ncbi:hypothetical protein C6988_07020 [Nitrosopumilus sp. b1]|uniref:hypothetical protein n=1 Tax=Nitrosopumilus sp. b1 TaxID=2109907 RepID=UPI0015F4C107|nr:hypothetical protein [Nitrosopumilus sp. b1]KAF6242913.1 hypothetical protein C6988_07020 [Nitrosopumilus sp. b1]